MDSYAVPKEYAMTKTEALQQVALTQACIALSALLHNPYAVERKEQQEQATKMDVSEAWNRMALTSARKRRLYESF